MDSGRHKCFTPGSAPEVEDILTGGKNFPAAEHHSTDLRDMVRTCLSFDVADRLTLKEIYNTASQTLKEPGMMDAVMDWDKLGLSLPSDRDGFRLGQAFVLAKHIPKEGVEDNQSPV